MRYYPYLANIPFMRISAPRAQLFTESAVQTLFKTFIETVASRQSRTAIVWPTPFVAALLPQLTTLWHITDRDNNPDITALTQAEQKSSLATLVWPFVPAHERLLDSVLAYRRIIIRQNRSRRCGGRCSTFHTHLFRLADLDPHLASAHLTESQMAVLRGNDALQHPSLADISPILVIGDNMRESVEWCRRRFLKRVVRYTQLRVKEIPSDLFDPARTPFVLFGLPPDSVLWRGYHGVLRTRVPDIVLIDVEQAERSHGEEWPEQAKKVLDYTRMIVGDKMPPLLVIGRSLFDAYQVRTKVVNERPAETLVINTSSDMLSQAVHTTSRSGVPNYVITCLGRHLTPLLRRGQRLADDLEPLDARIATTVHNMQFLLRTMICSPTGMADCDRIMGEEGHNLFGMLKPQKLLGDLHDQIRFGRAGAEEQRAKNFSADFEAALEGLVESTPAENMLRQLVRTERERNENLNNFYDTFRTSMVVLSNYRTERLAVAMLEGAGYDDEPWLEVTNGMKGLDYCAQRLPTFDKIYLLMPRWNSIERLLAWDANPGIVHLICDEPTAIMFRKQAGFLRESRLYAPIRNRVEEIWKALDMALEGAEYDLNPHEVPQRPPALYCREGEGRPMALVTTDGRHITLLEGTRLVRYQANAEPRPFNRTTAGRLEPGDLVFVADDDYTDMVQRHCLVSRDAPGFIRHYHETIKTFSGLLAGDSVRDKARDLLARMVARGADSLPTLETAVNWLNVDGLLGESLDVVRPHAPQSKSTFDVFAAVIGLSQNAADQFWLGAVAGTRSLRIRAGFSLLNYGIELLTDQDSALQMWGGDDEDLHRCEDYARSAMVEVGTIEKERP